MQNKSHINKGLTIAAVLICFNIITQFTKNNFNEWTTFVFAAIIIIGVAVSVFLLAKSDDNNLKFAQLFGYGFKTGAVIACVYFIYTILAVYIFFPDFVNEKLKHSIEEAKRQGAMDDKTVKANLEALNGLGKKVAIYMHIAGTIMGTLFLGIIGSLIGTVTTNRASKSSN
ncbi:MAG: DUF4199 domain-containing protein [Chitinophagaceae bacterium]